MYNDINKKLVVEFLQDPKFWKNLEVVLQHIAEKNPESLAILNADIVSKTLMNLEKQRKQKQYALSEIYLIDPKKDSFLFFKLFYATKELYPIPSKVLNDSLSNQKTFKLFIKEYQDQNLSNDWKNHYDDQGWLDQLDKWLSTEEAKNFLYV